MDSSSRKIVGIIAIFTIVILAVMAGNMLSETRQVEETAAVEPPTPMNDSAEAAMTGDGVPQNDPQFSTQIPTAEDIPAIDGKPSMTFENDSSNDSPVVKESTKGIPGQTDAQDTVRKVE